MSETPLPQRQQASKRPKMTPRSVRRDSDTENEKETPKLAGMTMKEIQRMAIEQTLEFCHGNKAMAARMLGISEKTVYNRMDRLGIPRARLVKKKAIPITNT